MNNRSKIYDFGLTFLILFLLMFNLNASSNLRSGSSAAVDEDLEIIRERVIANVMRPAVDEASVELALNTITPGGYWPGINYEDVSRTGFDQTLHLSNMIIMARAYKKSGNRYTGNQELKRAISAAFDFWLEHDFICDNWWHNQIGTPRSIINFMLIMDDELTDRQVTEGLKITGRANMQASGARQSGDRIFMAGLRGRHGVFKRDTEILENVIGVMASDIQIISDGPGIKPDLSYHHRKDNVVSTLTYGLHPPRIFSTWALKIEGTRFEFPESAMELLVDYYLDGVCRSMVYGKYSDPGVQNREISRMTVLEAASPQIAEALYRTSHHRREELATIAKIRRGEIEPDLRYTSFFWHSEYFIHQRPDWYASVRMYSERNNNIDAPHNEEGLKNHHFADGSNFLSITAEEYDQIFPVWDWQRVPGTTVVQKPGLPHWNEIVRKGPSVFVGGVTDDEYGAAVFDFVSPHDPLQARKSWFFFDDEYVALGSGISSNADFPVNTTISQRYLTGDIVTGQNNKRAIPGRGEHSMENLSWLFHDDVAYLFPSQSSVNLRNTTSTGNWREINHGYWATEEELSADLFTLWVDHGTRPEGQNYEYIVVPGIELEAVENYRRDLPVRILSNTTSQQAVRHDDLGITQVVFYEAGDIDLGSGIRLSVNKSCMVMVKERGRRIARITVSDPSRTHGTIELTINSRVRGNGDSWKTTWSRRDSRSVISLDMPGEEMAGRSVIMDL
ncbi:MAG: polysaccharide lyase family 8 super-sandwich domain-containing protein [bacterium]